jgi:NTP pyrophosphatase (non-canonical NTP hydrolase)
MENMSMPDYFDKLYLNVDGYNRRFPEGDTPFRIMSRLCEEAGELAKAVNHFEGTGIKRQKYGEPDRIVLAKEVQDVIRTAMCVVRYYGVEDELKRSIDETYQRLCDGGYIEDGQE